VPGDDCVRNVPAASPAKEKIMINVGVRVACMSLKWGRGNMPSENVPAWLDDLVKAGYDGTAVFDRELFRFTQEVDFQ